MNMNEIYIKKRNKVIINNLNSDNNVFKNYVITAMKNLETYGYTFSEKLYNKLLTVDKDSFIKFYTNLKTYIKNIVGERGDMIPMYPNFPQQVMEMEESELYLNAIIHYLSFGTILPDCEIKERFPLIENPNLTIIDLGDEEEFKSIFTNLLSSKISISNEDKEIVEWFINNIDLKDIIPNEIPNKENLAYISKLLWNTEYRENIIHLYKTPTDVLRLAVALSNGDISLKEHIKFINFKRSERKLFMSMLENMKNIEEDMLRHKILWIRLGERIYPTNYKRFVKVNIAFDKLRNKKHINTFRSKLEELYDNKNIYGMVKLLYTRSGEFARNLDRILRLCNSKEKSDYVLKEFNKVSDKVTTNILIQLRQYFINRKSNYDLRVFYPKGSICNAYGIKNNLKELDYSICDRVIKICEKSLIVNYSEKELLGKVYLDEEFKRFSIPMVQRNASKQLKSVARGSKFKIKEDSNYIRCFLYWKEPEEETVDLDLSIVLYDENFKTLKEIAYYNLKEEKYGCYHSGDITSAPNGASEYIDVDLNKIKENNVKYISLVVNSYSHTPFSNLPQCFVGFMGREDCNIGEIYEPCTVENKSDISNNSKQVLPMIIDVDNNEVIWCDLSITTSAKFNNVNSNKNSLLITIKSILNSPKANLYDLIKLHIISRGEEVNTKDEADIVFSINGDITPYDTDIILGEYI